MNMSRKLSTVLVICLLLLISCNSRGNDPDNSIIVSTSASTDTIDNSENEEPLKTSPEGRIWHGAVYDTNRESYVLIGGLTQSDDGIFAGHAYGRPDRVDMWSLDVQAQQWEQTIGNTDDDIFNNLMVEGFTLGFDPEAEKIAIFGPPTDDTDTTETIATYIFDPIAKTLVKSQAESAPIARWQPGVVYHSEAERLVMFGGWHDGGEYDGIWTYDVADDQWESIKTTGGPLDRAEFNMIYNADNNLIYIYGGESKDSQIPHDLWAFNLETASWTEILTKEAPRLQKSAVGAYDMQSHQYIVYGFRPVAGAAPVNETWAFDHETQTWSNMQPAVSPKIEHPGEAVYSAELDRVLFFGGGIKLAGREVSSDLWAYDFEGNTWEVIDTR